MHCERTAGVTGALLQSNVSEQLRKNSHLLTYILGKKKKKKKKRREIHTSHIISFSLPASVQTIETENQRDPRGWGSKSQTGYELSLSGMLT